MTRTRRPILLRWTIPTLLVVSVVGCASYQAKPLPQQVTTPPLSSLVIGKLDMVHAAGLAATRNLSLQTGWQQVQVAAAKAHTDGALPYPSLSFSLDHPLHNEAPFNAWNAGVTEDLVGLLAHGDKRSAAKADYAAALLAWQWQRIQIDLETRLAYVDAWQSRTTLDALTQENDIVAHLLQAATTAKQQGDLNEVDYLAIVGQASNTQTNLQATRVANLKALSHLAGLLDVGAIGNDDLVAPPSVTFTDTDMPTLLDKLSTKRLDLLAFKAGYDSEDAHLRADILSQFPIASIGLNRARDTSGVNSVGFGLTITLPFFNDSRGRIDIDKATRDALYAAYAERLHDATNQIEAIHQQLLSVNRDMTTADTNLTHLQTTANAATQAAAQGDLSLANAASAKFAWLDAEIRSHGLHADANQLAMTLAVLLAEPIQSDAQNHALNHAPGGTSP